MTGALGEEFLLECHVLPVREGKRWPNSQRVSALPKLPFFSARNYDIWKKDGWSEHMSASQLWQFQYWCTLFTVFNWQMFIPLYQAGAEFLQHLSSGSSVTSRIWHYWCLQPLLLSTTELSHQSCKVYRCVALLWSCLLSSEKHHFIEP